MKPYAFCPMCGSPLQRRIVDHRERAACSSCSFIHYRNPAPAAGVLLVEDGSVLLVRRKYEPRRRAWSIPAGFLEFDEDIRECAVREIKEETNLDIEIDRLFNVYSAFDDPRTTALLVLFLGRRVGGELRCGDDAMEARYFSLERLPEALAFQAHVKALRELRDHLKR